MSTTIQEAVGVLDDRARYHEERAQAYGVDATKRLALAELETARATDLRRMIAVLKDSADDV